MTIRMRLPATSWSRRWRWPVTALDVRWGLLPLLLWAYMISAEKKASDYYVHSLPGAPDGPLLKMHAGHIEVDSEHNGHLFFWHFQNRHIANRQRTVIWLNGGPGCSSMDGVLMEVGPYRLRDDHSLRYNDGSWHEFANLLFVDQPVGTGFSYVNTDSFLHDLDEMAAQFMIFLEKYFSIFPQYAGDDIYMAGESYAGQHIPYIAQAILKRNDANPKQKWNLKGLLIGNGWISPLEQYQSYLPQGIREHVLEEGSPAAKQLETQQALCNGKLNEPGGTEPVEIPECEKILSAMLKATSREVGGERKCFNMYDARLLDSFPSCGMNWPPDLSKMEPYLRRQDVLKALHVNADKNTGWTECVSSVGLAFKAKKSKPSIDILPGLLERLRVVLYSGEKDLICNHLGTEEMIHNMVWNGGRGFELSPGTWAPRRDWTFESEPVGMYQEARNLTYVLFYNASHMVPFDYPRRTRDMLDRFMEVDIASIGGTPADSRIDGEKGLEVSVGGHPNSTVAEEKEKQKLKQARWDAYYRSGEIVLVIVVVAAAVWGWFVWRDRRRHAETRYYGLLSPTAPQPVHANGASHVPSIRAPSHPRHQQHHKRRGPSSSNALERLRHQLPGGVGGLRVPAGGRGRAGDVEAADFDESELDELHPLPSSPIDDRADAPIGGREKTKEKTSVGAVYSDGEGAEKTTEKTEGRSLGLGIEAGRNSDDDDDDDDDRRRPDRRVHR